MNKVITYRLAYTNHETTLCAKHAAEPEHPLGPVQHGARYGACDVCEREPAAADRRANAYLVRAPRYPGEMASVISGHATLEAAQAAAQRFCSGRADLLGQDVRIENADGDRICYAGTGN